MNIQDVRKNTNWVILDLFKEVEQLKKEIDGLKKTKADKRKKKVADGVN